MDAYHLTIDKAPADIGLALSAQVLAATTASRLAANAASYPDATPDDPAPPAVPGTGRAVMRLCNVDDNATIYLAFQKAAPDGSDPMFPAVTGIPVRLGEWFPHDLDIWEEGGIWAWASRDGTKAVALLVKLLG